MLKPRLSTLLIDDQPENTLHLRGLLMSAHPEIEIIGSAASIAEAESMIRDLKPDLLFLDVELTDGTGFDLLERIIGFHGHIVFVTAYEQYAVRAFRAHAVDYLLKPVEASELAQTIEKVAHWNQRYQENDKLHHKYLSAVHQAGKLRNSANFPDHLMISSNRGVEMVKLSDIAFIEADNTYSIIHLLSGKKITASRPLLEFEDLVDPKVFFRTHRSYLVNASAIKRVDNQQLQIMLVNGMKVPVSRRKLPGFNTFLRAYSGVA